MGAAATAVARVVAWPSAKTPGLRAPPLAFGVFGALDALDPAAVVAEPDEAEVGVFPPVEPPVEPPDEPVEGVLVLGVFALPGPDPQEPTGAFNG